MFEKKGTFDKRSKNLLTKEGKAVEIERNVKYLSQYVKGKPKTLYDIGIGQEPHNEAKAFQQLWPDITIIGLEPDLKVFCDRVDEYVGILYPWGLWKENAICKFSISNYHGWSSLLHPHHEWINYTKNGDNMDHISGGLIFTEGVLISCITLDHLDKMLGCPQDIFLWMDIEGAELGALEGGKDTLASGRIKWIDVEISRKPRRFEEPSEVMISDYLKQYNYCKTIQYGNARLFYNVLYELKG